MSRRNMALKMTVPFRIRKSHIFVAGAMLGIGAGRCVSKNKS
jgi:hypothetical protein